MKTLNLNQYATLAEHIDAANEDLVACASWLASREKPRWPNQFSSVSAWQVYTLARLAAKRAVEKHEWATRKRLKQLHEAALSGVCAEHDERARALRAKAS